MKKTNKKLFNIVVCILLVLSMAVCALPMSASEDAAATDTADTADTVQIVRLLKDVEQGARILKDMVETQTVKNVNIPENAVHSVEDVVGKYAKNKMFSGEYIYAEQVSGDPVRKANPDLLNKPVRRSEDDYLIVTDYVIPNTGEDLSYHLQKLIDDNPKRTLYFPDGVYTIAYPLSTPAKANSSVSLKLSEGAVIKAHQDWRGEKKDDGDDALILLGNDSANDIVTTGSYYGITGGTLDGNKVANGINIEGGRETLVRGVCIKDAKVGILIKEGINNSSSDCDFEDITIIGSGMRSSVGVQIDACDNTLTNIRIYNTETGVSCGRGGNLMSEVFVINDNEKLISSGRASGIKGGADNWISGCYVENCTTAFSIRRQLAITWDCTAAWTSPLCKKQEAFRVYEGKGSISGCKAFFCKTDKGEYIYSSGTVCIDGAVVDTSFSPAGLGSAVASFPTS